MDMLNTEKKNHEKENEIIVIDWSPSVRILSPQYSQLEISKQIMKEKPPKQIKKKTLQENTQKFLNRK